MLQFDWLTIFTAEVLPAATARGAAAITADIATPTTLFHVCFISRSLSFIPGTRRPRTRRHVRLAALVRARIRPPFRASPGRILTLDRTRPSDSWPTFGPRVLARRSATGVLDGNQGR